MPIESYCLRPLHGSDYVWLSRNCWPNYLPDYTRTWLDRTLTLTAQGRAFSYVAVPKQQEDRPMAYGQITRWPHVAEISDLVVAEPWRGNGVGSALIQMLITKASIWAVPTVEIGVAMDNGRALALYRRFGFVDTRTLTLDLGSGPEPVLYLTMPFAPRVVPER
jgi:GNAT superfamily N-acetyltransferase